MEFNLDVIADREQDIAIVTGANTGLGFETVLGLVSKKITVIMACRNLDKANIAKDKIMNLVPQAKIDVMVLDLSSLKSVREFTAKFKDKYSKLDLLINNAGIMYGPYTKTEDGFESQFGTNHLGHFLLTNLLIDHMPNTSDSRIVALSSLAHKMGKIKLNNLNAEKSYSPFKAYNQSKLACLMFAEELNRRLKNDKKEILSVAAHPGISLTDLFRNLPPLLDTLRQYTLNPFFTHPASKGAKPTLMAALEKNIAGGSYFGPQGFLEMSGKPGIAFKTKYSQRADIAQKLWDLSSKLTNFNAL